MNELRVIENELVPVYETSAGRKVVYGTELHGVLGVKSRFNDWVRNRLNDCEATENEDYEAVTKNLVSGGQAKEYIIKLDTAKEMAMLERNEKGKQVRRYFIAVEKKYKESPKSHLQLLELELAALKEVDGKVDAVNKDLQEFKKDLPILGVEEGQITNAVKRKGVNCLGGKNSNAYKDRPLRTKLYCDIHRELKRQFGVTTYKAIKRSQCETAIKIIEEYEPPLYLKEQISYLNAQENLEVA